MCQLFETKGCHTFSCQERSCILVVVNKKKISFYLWLGKRFDHLSDGMLNDVPKIIYCLPQSVIVGYKRCYEAIDVPTMTASKSGPNTLGSLSTYIRTCAQMCILYIIYVCVYVCMYVCMYILYTPTILCYVDIHITHHHIWHTTTYKQCVCT